MSDSISSVREKVEAILRELAGDRATMFDPSRLPWFCFGDVTGEPAATKWPERVAHGGSRGRNAKRK
jgi:hypothetical protein